MGQFDFNNPVHQLIASFLGYSISDSDYSELDSENIYDDMPELIPEYDEPVFSSYEFYIHYILSSAYEIVSSHLMITLPMPTGFQNFLSIQFPFNQFSIFGSIQPYMLLLTSADHDISDLDATDFDSLLLILQAN
jgi:hypothetical protein